MTSDSINNTVCKACGKPHHALKSLCLNKDDPFCEECRAYEQHLIQQKVLRTQREQDDKRLSYFSYLR